MNFLIIHNRYSKTGGEESVVAEQYAILREQGHNVALYERSYDEISTWKTGRIGSFFTSLYNADTVRDIRKLIVDHNIDIALIHNLFPIISPAILPVLHKSGVKVIMTLHNFRLVCPTGLFFRNGQLCESCGNSSLREWQCALHRCEGSLFGSAAFALRSCWARLKKYYVGNVDRFCALSDFQRDKLISYGLPAIRTVVLPNPVRLQDEKALHYPTDRKFIGFVGRFSQEKGAMLLIDAARCLPNIHFKVAGQVLIDIESVPDNIEFVGFLNREQLDKFYLTARAVVSTSLCYETFGLVIAEAMTAGAVGIVPNMAAMPELVDGGQAGLIYQSGSIESLIKCIDSIVHDDVLFDKLSQSGKQYIANRYSSVKYYENLMGVCNELLISKNNPH